MPTTAFLAVAAPHPAASITACDAFAAYEVDRIRAMPLINCMTSSRLGTLDDPLWIRFSFEKRRPLRYAGLWVNLKQSSRWRLQAFADDEETRLLFDTRRGDGRDRRVIPRLFTRRRRRDQTDGVPWGASNSWRLDLPDEWFLTFPGVIHHTFAECRPKVMRWSFYGGALAPDRTSASWVTVGFAPVCNGIDLVREAGSSEGHNPNADVQKVVGGGSSVDPGVDLRSASIDLRLLSTNERRTLHVLTAQAGNDLPIIYLPNTDSPAENFLFGGVFRIATGGTSFARSRPIWSDTKINLEEWRE